MTRLDFARRYLRAIEKKHKDYFIKANINIMNCVSIEGTKVISVHVINSDLPFEITYDIESMFWRH
jgi:hypothetical protein